MFCIFHRGFKFSCIFMYLDDECRQIVKFDTDTSELEVPSILVYRTGKKKAQNWT